MIAWLFRKRPVVRRRPSTKLTPAYEARRRREIAKAAAKFAPVPKETNPCPM